MKNTFDLQKPQSRPRKAHAFLEMNTPFFRDWFKKQKLAELVTEENLAIADADEQLMESTLQSERSDTAFMPM
jgi:hypothetical protein